MGARDEPKLRRKTSVNKSDTELSKAEKNTKTCKGLLKAWASVEKSILHPWLEQLHRKRDVCVEDLGEMLAQVVSTLNFPVSFLDIAVPGLCIFLSVCCGTSSILKSPTTYFKKFKPFEEV